MGSLRWHVLVQFVLSSSSARDTESASRYIRRRKTELFIENKSIIQLYNFQKDKRFERI